MITKVMDTNGTAILTDDTVASSATGVSGSTTVNTLGAGTYYVIVSMTDSPFCPSYFSRNNHR